MTVIRGTSRQIERPERIAGIDIASMGEAGVLVDSLGPAEALLFNIDHPVDDPWCVRAGYRQGAIASPGMSYVSGSVNSSRGSVNWLWNLIGLSRGHERGAIVRAIPEGLAYEARSGSRPLLRLTGSVTYPDITTIGGSRNELLLRIKASVLQTTVRSIDVQEATSLGAAMLAAIAAGFSSDVAGTRRHVHHEPARFEPDPAWAEPYDRLYQDVVCKLYGIMKHLRHTLQELTSSEGTPA